MMNVPGGIRHQPPSQSATIGGVGSSPASTGVSPASICVGGPLQVASTKLASTSVLVTKAKRTPEKRAFIAYRSSSTPNASPVSANFTYLGSNIPKCPCAAWSSTLQLTSWAELHKAPPHAYR